MSASQILQDFSSCGIVLSLDISGNIRLKAPESLVTNDVRRIIKENKPELIRELSVLGASADGYKKTIRTSCNADCNRLLSMMQEFNRLIVDIETSRTNDEAIRMNDRISELETETKTLARRTLTMSKPIDWTGLQILQAFWAQEAGEAFDLSRKSLTT